MFKSYWMKKKNIEAFFESFYRVSFSISKCSSGFLLISLSRNSAIFFESLSKHLQKKKLMRSHLLFTTNHSGFPSNHCNWIYGQKNKTWNKNQKITWNEDWRHDCVSLYERLSLLFTSTKLSEAILCLVFLIFITIHQFHGLG